MRIVFMGTPDFALPPLQALVRAGHEIVAVYTQPDKPQGRGKKIQAPPVKEEALLLGLPVFQPSSMKGDAVYQELFAHQAEVFVVVAYGHILPARLLALPSLGAINIHASLLPKYRGAAPIQWAVAHGEKETGVTTMMMDAGMDTGDILLQKVLPIEKRDTASDIHDRLSLLGADLIVETLDALTEKRIKPIPQNPEEATYAPLLKKEDGRIPWHLPASAIDAHVRGMTPWPGAFTQLGDRVFKIFEVQAIASPEKASPGTLLKAPPATLMVAAGEGAVLVNSLQGPSGKRMPAADFLRGRPLPPGAVFS
ncbi:methionyl-tRNA formyltransferase [Desulfobotulus sp.]|jgi:methionyl-tRNA formyltransferase|uniref:methionyl-tRNA formyltransferase n=1 Tax=Desulfobotulus sp. TaxID=1940337 RepID=UPI002A36B1C9|nr:methionyl-tRNA formyltransferase [Desulfobotulus sp.]MDY0161719.1 methionyl-tRNA formyltransferase [Desulfobotulus sp.]